ncbi:MAG: hypothetical protein PARBB_03255 [Parabacteroides distasonis]
MKTHLLTLCILLGSFFSISLVYGDNIPTHGEWDDERYRSITALPPTLSIDNNILSIEFKDALDNLTIHITDENSNIIYENTFSGAMGDIIDIAVNGMRTGTYQVILTHKLGWLVGEFENQ